jgi:hypothetical protein
MLINFVGVCAKTRQALDNFDMSTLDGSMKRGMVGIVAGTWVGSAGNLTLGAIDIALESAIPEWGTTVLIDALAWFAFRPEWHAGNFALNDTGSATAAAGRADGNSNTVFRKEHKITKQKFRKDKNIQYPTGRKLESPHVDSYGEGEIE